MGQTHTISSAHTYSTITIPCYTFDDPISLINCNYGKLFVTASKDLVKGLYQV